MDALLLLLLLPENNGIRSLAEVPGLEPLADVCREFDVEITAHGSLVRRLYRKNVTFGRPLPDLFELTPFLSDIDLKHTGSSKQTAAIRDAILARVQSSECFRWDIRSEADLREFAADETHLPVIPANKLELATKAGRGISDSCGGKRD